MSKRAERFANSGIVDHPAIARETTAPAPGFDDIQNGSDDVPEAIRFERAVADEARRLTAERHPGVPAGTIDEGIREQVRRRHRRLQREDARFAQEVSR